MDCHKNLVQIMCPYKLTHNVRLLMSNAHTPGMQGEWGDRTEKNTR